MPKTDPDISASEQRVWLAVLGKHPGWNDHLDDIGLDTERLVAVKRHLYVEGVGGLINAGTWESMEEGERDEGFAHSFFWRQADGMVIGRMWSSSDGKGRKKYPMIACAMCRGLPFSFVSGPLLDRLRRLESECREVSTAAEVIGAADRMRAELAELASFVPELTGEPVAGDGRPGSAAILSDSAALGENGVGLKRVLYQVEREMTAFIRPEGSGTASRSRSVEVRGQHIRVPRPAGGEESGHEHDAIGLWCRLLLSKVDPLAPVFFAVKDDRPWVDVIVGELGPTPLSCLQGGTESHPLTSDIPFTIDGEIAESLDAVIAASRRGEVSETDPCFVDVPPDRLAPFLRPKRTERAARAEGDGQKRMLIIAAAVVVVIVLAVLVGRLAGGKGDERTESDAEAVRDPAPVAEAPDTPGEPSPPEQVGVASSGRLEAFLAWCAAHGDFYGPFVRALDTDAVEADDSLAPGLMAALSTAERAGDDIDPLAMTPGRFRSLSSLVGSPPDAVYDPAFGAVIDRGAAAIDGVRGAISAESWGTRRQLESIVSRARASDAEIPVGIETLLEGLGTDDGEEAARAVAGVALLAGGVRSARADLERFAAARGSAERVDSAGVGSLVAALEPLRGLEADEPEQWLSLMASRARAWAGIAERAAAAAREGLPRVDPGLLSARMAQVGQPRNAEATVAFVAAWTDAVGDPALYLLDPDTDPRRRLGALPAVGDLRDALGSLAQQEANRETLELGGMLDAFEASASALAEKPWNEATKDDVAGETDDLVALSGTIAERIDAERRRRAVEAERYIAGLRETPSVTASGSAAIDAAWIAARDAAIESFEADGDVVALSRAIDRSRERLGSIESGMPRIDLDADALGPMAGAASQAVAAERESLLARAAGGDGPGAIASYEAWASDLRRAFGAYAHLRAAMGEWLLDGERASAPEPSESAGVWRASWLRESVGEGGERQIEAYAEALSATTAEPLLALLDPESASPAAMRAGWTRIATVDPSWPASLEHLRIDAAVAGALLRAAADLPEARGAEVRESVRRIGATRWTSVARAADRASFGPVAVLARRMEIDTEALPGALRFDLFVEDLRASVARGEPIEREALLDGLHALGEVVGGFPEGEAWLGAFTDELSAREGREIDYRVIGPARAGWAVEPFDSGRRLVYTWNGEGEARRLAFRLVESAEAGVFYLCETEAPLWLLTDYALAGPSREPVLSALPEDWDPLPDTRLGPRSWTWSTFRGDRVIRRARNWVDGNGTPDRPFYAEGMIERVGKPSDGHPIQRVSATAAAVLASSAGCRLPTALEWRAAAGRVGAVVPSESVNLRDATFDAQRAHTVSLGAGIAVVWGEQQSFADGLDGVPGGASAASHPGSDGALWFLPVDAGGDRGFKHLVGNVAEFVLPGLDGAAPLGDRGGGVEEVTRAVSERELSTGLIGGSALSPPSVALDQPVNPGEDSGELGYTDVGFRLAFSPGVEAPLVVVVGEMLRDAPFLRGEE
jgi:hypothetical protein